MGDRVRHRRIEIPAEVAFSLPVHDRVEYIVQTLLDAEVGVTSLGKLQAILGAAINADRNTASVRLLFFQESEGV